MLCLEIIGDIEYELNRDHPSFTGSDTYEENGNDYDDLEYIDGAPMLVMFLDSKSQEQQDYSSRKALPTGI